ncbi:LuxR family maltose regulon positive regulatory protein [Actinoplanes teichomyceticus]|uniref:LuxR family maltose regulon positive regulatory protein n=1 Tax=Actinoplanes teichomyceticus TaxID=1867 RepID=A0A561VCJ3_ACTTI|nr:LuxR family maltose regulon positive regulatory protein [Actinoplanes teichomyceticus]GIF16671.1 transcriptional regulator [Actinoplanes teichomyceticus]
MSSPAGWGKSALLESWAAGRPDRAAWVAGGDRDGFWHRVLSAVATTGVDAPFADVTAATGPQRLIEALQRSSAAPTILVDDCNDTAEPGELAGLAQAARSSGTATRLILACRGSPNLPLHRWRVEGRLAEISQAELAFTVDETADLLAGHELILPWLAIAELHAQTEGWPAGLRLTAVALQHHADPAQILAGSAAIDSVADYLAAEVLGGLEPGERWALAEISVAERLTADFVNAMTGRVDGAALLAGLEHGGAFITRCAATEDTYRLHPMLGRTLYRELGRHDRNRTAQAHRRAADWHAAQGPPADVLRHLLAAGDGKSAIHVAERHWAEIVVGGRCLDQPVTTIPAPDGEPPRHLWFAMAAERLDAGDIMGTRHLLRLAYADEKTYADGQGAESLPFAALELTAARLEADLDGGCALASQVLATPASGEGPAAGTAAMLHPLALLSRGAAELQRGELPAAERDLCDALTLARRRDMERAAISAASHLAACHAARGHLRQAARCATETLDRANRLRLVQLVDLGWSRLALAETYFEWDRLDDAERCAAAAVDGSRGDRLIQLWGTVLQARIRTATGRPGDAHRMVRAVAREMVTADLPAAIRCALALVEGELRLACGDLNRAHELVQACRDVGALPVPAAVLEGSVLLAEGRPARAATAVEPYVAAHDELTSRTYRAWAGLVSALAGQRLGHPAQTTRGLETALQMAEEEDLRRGFAAGGHRLRALLESVAPTMPVFSQVAATLTVTLDATMRDSPPYGSRNGPDAVPAGSAVPPLTDRELTVLRHLQGSLSHAEIAELLHISVNTVKTHVKNIYSKLGATRRKDAIRRGHELRFL